MMVQQEILDNFIRGTVHLPVPLNREPRLKPLQDSGPHFLVSKEYIYPWISYNLKQQEIENRSRRMISVLLNKIKWSIFLELWDIIQEILGRKKMKSQPLDSQYSLRNLNINVCILCHKVMVNNTLCNIHIGRLLCWGSPLEYMNTSVLTPFDTIYKWLLTDSRVSSNPEIVRDVR